MITELDKIFIQTGKSMEANVSFDTKLNLDLAKPRATYRRQRVLAMVVLSLVCLIMASTFAVLNYYTGEILRIEVVGISDSGSSIKIENDYWSRGKFEEPDIQKTNTISYKNEEFIGNYRSSMIRDWDNYVSRFYNLDQTGNKWCTLNAKTGELLSYYNIAEINEATKELPVLSEVELKKIAIEHVKEFINPDEYSLSIKDLRPNGFDEFVFTFVKFKNNIETADRVVIYLNSRGGYTGFAKYMIGEFDNIDELKLDWEQINKSLEVKIKEVYKDREDYKGFELQKHTVSKLEDDSLVLCCDVYIERGFSDKTLMIELIQLAIYI